MEEADEVICGEADCRLTEVIKGPGWVHTFTKCYKSFEEVMFELLLQDD